MIAAGRPGGNGATVPASATPIATGEHQMIQPMPAAGRKLGRLPRAFDARIPHLSALSMTRGLPPPPETVDWTQKLQPPLGMMLNNTLSCCTCSAFFHARQVWSANASAAMLTDPDKDVLALYEQACGYRPGDPSTDQGGVEQAVLAYLLKTGAPVGDGRARDRIVAFIEVDPRNINDVKRTIDDCGLAYIGFNVPQNIMPADADPPAIWTVDPANAQILGGHAVVLPGYDPQGARVISWGQEYRMTWEFFSSFVDEAYAIADRTWIDATGRTPLGMTIAELEAQMQALRRA